MRVKELRPNTEYATARGALVVTGDTVERGWWAVEISKDQQSRTIKRVAEPAGRPADPWGPANRRPTKGEAEGILVTEHLFDRDGKRVEGSATECVVDPRDIKGTWAQYMELHGEEVAARFARDEAKAAARAEHKRVTEAMKKEGLDPEAAPNEGRHRLREVDVKTDILWTVEGPDGKERQTTWVGARDKVAGWEVRSYVTLPAETLENYILSANLMRRKG